MNHLDNVRLTVLPPMPLRSDEDGNFEALDHYLARLAHSVALAPRALSRLLWKASGRQGKCITDMQSRSPWIGPHPMTASCVSILSACTGAQDLWRGTFLRLEGALAGVGFASADESVGGRKWCPTCYDAWDDSVSFEPLYWAIGSLSVCPKHGCLLLSRCIHCGSKQYHGCTYDRRRTCRSCQLSLGHQAPHRHIEAFSFWVNLQAVSVARVASSRPSALPPDTFDRYFTRVLVRWTEGEPIPRYAKASMQNLQSAWSRGERLLKPSITQYLNFAAFHGTSVEEILVSPETAAAEPLVEGALATFSPYQSRRSIKSTLGRVIVALERLVQSDIRFIPSVFTIVSAFDVSATNFRGQYPEATEAYSLSRAASGKAYGKSDLRRAFACAVAVLREKGNRVADSEVDSLISVVATRSRASNEIAQCGVNAARIVLEHSEKVNCRER